MIFAKFMARFNKRGFTLVELIVVIAILAVLAVTAVMAIGNLSEEARLASLRADCNTAVRALNTYNALINSGSEKDTFDEINSVAELQGLNVATSSGIVNLELGISVADENRALLIANNLRVSTSGVWRINEPISLTATGGW
jgi:prepilin-type N-terminal cleavage/methylation domain-containing protein